MGVLEKFGKGDHAGVIDGMPEYRKAYPEGHFGHYLMMAAALGGRDCTATGRAVQRVRGLGGHGPGARVVRAARGGLDGVGPPG